MMNHRTQGYGRSCLKTGVLALVAVLVTCGIAVAAPQYDLTCETCHHMPPVDSVDGKRVPITGAFKGNHETHAGATADSCAKCHGAAVLNYSTGHRTKQIHVAGNINNSPAGGSYSRGFFNQSSIPPVPLGSCASVNCHFETATPEWGTSGTFDCSSCHMAVPDSKSHPAHTGLYGGASSCDRCHTPHTTFSHATTAGRRPINVVGAGYSGSNGKYLRSQDLERTVGTCSTASCHSNPYGSGNIVTPTWGTSAGCETCHTGDPGLFQSNGAPATGSHGKHLALNGSACGQCHDGAVKNSTGGTYHADGKIDVLNGYPATAKHPANSYTGTCSTASCHSNPYGSGYVTTPVWGQSAGCGACHKDGGAFNGTTGAPETGSHAAHMALIGSSCGLCHSGAASGVSGGDSHANGTVEVLNDYVGSPVAKHPSGSYSGSCASASCHASPYGAGAVPSPVWGSSTGCASCHKDDGAFVANGAPATGSHPKHMALNGALCNQCHPGAVSGSSGGLTHSNGSVDVANGYTASPVPRHPLGSYEGTCTTASCHNDGRGTSVPTPTWGIPMPPNCTGCHGGAADVTPESAILNTGKHRSHMNNYSTLGRGNNLKCAECHARTVSLASNTTITGPSHLNGFRDYSGVKAGSTFDTGTGVCSNVYCHSSGQANPVFVTMTGSKAWTGSAKLDCSGCHGNAAGAGWNSGFGAPNYTNGPETPNSHEKHVIATSMTDSRGCSRCHYTTVDSSVAAKMRDYSTAHLNRTRDVAFRIAYAGYSENYKPVGKTCTTYCHSNVQAPGGNGPATTYAAPAWGNAGSTTCSTCHANMATLPESTESLQLGSHRRHAVAYATMSGHSGAGYSCSVCHGAGYSAASYNPATHADGTISLAFTAKGAGTAYADPANNIPGTGYGSCTTSKCHGRGTKYWGQNTTEPTCEKCHGSARTAQLGPDHLFRDTAGSATSKYSGTHASHLGGLHNISNPIACSECHVVPASVDSFGHMSSVFPNAKLTFGTLATHAPNIPGGGTGGSPMSPSYSGAPGRACSNTYCHAGNRKKDVDGVTLIPSGSDPAPTWGATGYMGCDKCHGYPPPPPHNQSVNCNGCHAHVDQSNVAFIQNGVSLPPLNKPIDKSLHINGTVEVTVDNCAGCHSSTNGCQEGDNTCINKKLVGAHSAHTDADLFLTGKSLSNGDFIDPSWIYDIKYVNGFPKYACGTCHNMLDSGLHKNMQIDTDLDPIHSLSGTVKNKNKSGGPWFDTFQSGTNVTCRNVYCHSNGYISEETKSYDYQVTPNWYYADQHSGQSPWAGVDKCAQCHGNSPNTGGRVGSSAHGKHVVGIHYKDVFSGYSSKTLVAGGVGSGASHGDPNTSTTINCNICHFNTVKTDWNDKNPACVSCHTTAPKGTMNVYTSNQVHINGTVDVVFQEPFNLKSKAQLRNHITTVQSVYTSWTRVSGYKTYSSHDIARMKPSYEQGTCSTTACHNNTTMEWRTQGPLPCAACHEGLPQ